MTVTGQKGWPIEGMVRAYTVSLFLGWIPWWGGLMAGLAAGVSARSVKSAGRAVSISAVCFTPAFHFLVPVPVSLAGMGVPLWLLYLAGLAAGTILGGSWRRIHAGGRIGWRWLRSSV